MSVKSQVNHEAAVRQRYSQGAAERVDKLCCPIDYDRRYLAVIPQEILDRDYGCGDPSQFVQQGDTVLDLGSGGGKICYIAAQMVGPQGRVVGVDMNDDMLGLANKYRSSVAEAIGYDVVEFGKGKIQDLKLDYSMVDAYLQEHPVNSAADLLELEGLCDRWRETDPLIPDDSVDLVLSNCVLNLVKDSDKRQLFQELFRVLKRGGRAAISDIVSDEEVPENLKSDPDLWAGCISGSFQEQAFLKAFEDAGFYGIELVKRDEKPWRVIEGIEFRSVTVLAHKGKQGPCYDYKQAVIYRGPWKEVRDDDGHVLGRGETTAVCKKNFELYTKAPYADDIIGLEPREPIQPENAVEFDCDKNQVRTPRELKGAEYRQTDLGGGTCCEPGEKCC